MHQAAPVRDGSASIISKFLEGLDIGRRGKPLASYVDESLTQPLKIKAASLGIAIDRVQFQCHPDSKMQHRLKLGRSDDNTANCTIMCFG